MKAFALRQLSVNGLQLVLNQLFGVAIFYLLSVALSKPDFGRVNLALAILLALYTILSMGMDSLAVKKAATGNDAGLLPAFLRHVLLTGLAGYALLWAVSPWLPRHLYPLLPLLGLGKLFLFLSTPYKQIVSGREKFQLLARMSLVSNFIRCAGLLLLYLINGLTLRSAVMLFIVGDLIELITTVWLYRSLAPPAENAAITPSISASWFGLLREAAPQAGVVIITSLLARFDWICLGFISPAGRLAEYSFAYKAFEMAQLPLLMIAPMLLPRFTRFFLQPERRAANLMRVFHAELMVACGTALCIQAAWSPLIDRITSGRYGAVNQVTISLLCGCLPLIYVSNFFWSAWFAEGRLREILFSFLLAAGLNIPGCLLLIPLMGNNGAALAFLISSAGQAAFYLLRRRHQAFASAWQPVCLYAACALLAGGAGKLFSTPVGVLLASVTLYSVLLCMLSPLPATGFKNLREAVTRYATRQPANP